MFKYVPLHPVGQHMTMYSQLMYEKILGIDLKITDSMDGKRIPNAKGNSRKMWVRIHTQGDSQELLFGKQLPSDSSAVLSSQAMTALWVTLTSRFQGTDYRDT